MLHVIRPTAGHCLYVACLLFGLYLVVIHTGGLLLTWDGPGWDARAYHLVWEGAGVYEREPGQQFAFNYSPVFAQLVWPLTLLPWEVAGAVLVGCSVAGVLWLCHPLPLTWLVPALCVGSVQALSGNVDWLIAVIVVTCLGRGAPWVFVALTKVTPCLGPIWFLARREWRALGQFVAVLLLAVGISCAVAPDLWADWFAYLTANAGEAAGMPVPFLPPLWARVPAAVVMVVVAARRDRPEWLPVAMLLTVPVAGSGPLCLLLAIPRLVERRRVRETTTAEALASDEVEAARV